MPLLQFLSNFNFCLVYLKEPVHVNRTASWISEILIRNQLALIKDELLCHWHSGLYPSPRVHICRATCWVIFFNSYPFERYPRVYWGFYYKLRFLGVEYTLNSRELQIFLIKLNKDMQVSPTWNCGSLPILGSGIYVKFPRITNISYQIKQRYASFTHVRLWLATCW